MDTKIIRTDPEHIDPAAMREAGRILNEGGLVAFPREEMPWMSGLPEKFTRRRDGLLTIL